MAQDRSIGDIVGSSFKGFGTGIKANKLAAITAFLLIVGLTLFAAYAAGALIAPQFQSALSSALAVVAGVGLLAKWLVGQLIRLNWPQVALICFVVAIASTRFRSGLGFLWSRTHRLKWGGVEVELSPETAKELAITAEEAFKNYRIQANKFIKHQVSALDIGAYFEATVEDESLVNNGEPLYKAEGFRCTLYIRDVLFEDTLYQLVDYYPWDGSATAGRAFSSRFGIIGRAWRTGHHLGEEEVQSDPAKLVSEWGMTEEEARRGSRNRPAYVCAVIRAPNEDGSDGIPVAILFADSTKKGAFGTQAKAVELSRKAAEAAKTTELSLKLKDLRNELGKYSAAIETRR